MSRATTPAAPPLETPSLRRPSPNCELISGGWDGSLRRWRDSKPVGDGKPIATVPVRVLRRISSMIELKNVEVIIGGEDRTLRLWTVGKSVGDGNPIATGQLVATSLIVLKNGDLISCGQDGTLRRWRQGKPVGDGRPIATGQDQVESLIELKNGELISGGSDGTLRRWSLSTIARLACIQIDLASISTNTGLMPVVRAAQSTCRESGLLK